MKVLSAHLWEKKEDVSHMPISLVLQQACAGRKTIVLACVCEGKNTGEAGVTESGYFTEGLTEWFHRECIQLCERKEEERAADSLKREIVCLEKEACEYMNKKGLESKLHYWGILLIENRAWIFARGACKGFLLNRRFQKKNMREISMPGSVEKSSRQQVEVQKRIGILLCTEEFLNGWKPADAAEILIPDGELTEERMEKRLQEIWQEQVRLGRGTVAGAVYLQT